LFENEMFRKEVFRPKKDETSDHLEMLLNDELYGICR
jgi:hypothetical protein